MGAMSVMGGEPNVGVFIDDHKRRADTDLNAPPYDDLRNYAYEGGGSTAGSLSSLASGTHQFLFFFFFFFLFFFFFDGRQSIDSIDFLSRRRRAGLRPPERLGHPFPEAGRHVR